MGPVRSILSYVGLAENSLALVRECLQYLAKLTAYIRGPHDMNTKMIASPDTHSEYTPTSLVPASFLFFCVRWYGGYGVSRDVVDFLHSGAVSGRCPLWWSALRWTTICPAAPCRGTVRHVCASWLCLGACRRLSDTGFGLARPPTFTSPNFT